MILSIDAFLCVHEVSSSCPNRFAVDDCEATSGPAKENLGHEKGPTEKASERLWAVGSRVEERRVRPVFLQQNDG